MFDPDVAVVTVRLPVSAAQVTENVTLAVWPLFTVVVCELPPLTVQFPATPLSVTVWLPVATPLNVKLVLIPIACPVPPSTATA